MICNCRRKILVSFPQFALFLITLVIGVGFLVKWLLVWPDRLDQNPMLFLQFYKLAVQNGLLLFAVYFFLLLEIVVGRVLDDCLELSLTQIGGVDIRIIILVFFWQ